MNKEETKKLKKKMKLYKSLGAEKFQKVVFGVEKIKFAVLKKLFPNFLEKYDKHIAKVRKKRLKKAKTEEEKREIIRTLQFSTMEMRKEFHQEKNRNYHLDTKKPTEIIKYLEWNKSVHKKGLIKNSILAPIFILVITLGYPIAIIPLIYEIICAAINFECINIQNYNICRFKRSEDILRQQEKRKMERRIEEYGDAAEVIDRSIEQSEKVPTIEEVLANITSKEQLEQMKRLLLEELEERRKSKQSQDRGSRKC